MNYHKDSRRFDAAAGQLAFPLGGIGTGNVSLGARGDLRDWEIMNRPSKGSVLPLTFFAIRAALAGQDPVTRVLEGTLQGPLHLSHGHHPMTGSGLPRLEKSSFCGEYPFAKINFDDSVLPVEVELEAFTPLIPLNPEDSGIPCAIMTYSVSNPTDQAVDVTVVGTLANPVGYPSYDPFRNVWAVEHGSQVNSFRSEPGLRGLFMTNDEIDSQDLNFGSVGLSTDHEQVTMKRYWMRGQWWDFMQEFWDDLDSDGLLEDPDDSLEGQRMGTVSLGLVDTLQPGESKPFRFLLTWHFPNRKNTWEGRWASSLKDVQDIPLIHNHYVNCFEDAWAVARYLRENMARLEADSRKFHDALFGSTLPPVVLDAISANIVPLRSTTCFWLEDGRFFGWEGCYDDDGCCAGTCTHVWNYAFTVAYLFPSLEREMRRIEYRDELEANGLLHYRAYATFHPEHQWGGRTHPAADGQMGTILRAYREWLVSGDREFLSEIWPGVKSSMNFINMHWDPDNDGILEGGQHNTYDIEFFGPNALCGIFYLAALRAVEEMARVMGEDTLADNCNAAFSKGSSRLDELLWNGEYYIQIGENISEKNYQYGVGCLSDQLLGQLFAQVLGLGNLLPQEHISTALQSIFDYNFLSDFRQHVNVQRAYAFNDEGGLLLCTWPHGGRPRLPFPYSDEVWTGIEYQVAAHLIYDGKVDEGLQIVKAVRDRHDGIRRNPWNEVECGNHYARSMSSWAVLLALSGMYCDMGRGELSFAPDESLLSKDSTFKTFWSTGRAWGTYSQRWDARTESWEPSIEVLGGDGTDIALTLRQQPSLA